MYLKLTALSCARSVNAQLAELERAPENEAARAAKLVTVAGLEKAVSLPMPLELQLFALQRERARVTREGKAMEETIQPFLSRIPISQPSVDIWGSKAYTQRPNSAPQSKPSTSPGTSLRGAPHSRGPGNVTHPVRLTKQWAIDHNYFKRESIGPAHLLNRPQTAHPRMHPR